MNVPDLIMFSGPKSCYFDLMEDGKKCKMLRFLINTCNYWRDKKQLSEEETLIRNKNLLSRLCAIGYLFVPFKEDDSKYIVVATDNGQGCCGKSLLGDFLSKYLPSVKIDGRQSKKDLSDIDISFRTRLVNVDDIDREKVKSLSSLASVDWFRREPWEGEKVIPHSLSPKVYVSTNGYRGLKRYESVNIWRIWFSNYYNYNYHVIDDLGLMLNSTLDLEQERLNEMLINDCINLYIEFGFVQDTLCDYKTT